VSPVAEQNIMSLPAGAVGLEGHSGGVRRAVALPGSEFVVTVGDDMVVRVFSFASGALHRPLVGHADVMYGLAELGGNIIASGDRGGVLRVWNARTGECTHARLLHGMVDGIAAQGAGQFVASAANDMHFFAHGNGREVALVRSVPSGHTGDIMNIAACSGRFVTASWHDNRAIVWDAATLQRLAVLDDHTDDLRCIAMDERWVVSGSRDKTVRVYNARTFNCNRLLDYTYTGWVWSIVIVDSEHVLLGSQDGSAYVSELSSGDLVDRVDLPFRVFTTTITQDGRVAAAGGGGAIATVSGRAKPILMRRELSILTAARPSLALRAILAIELGANPSILRCAVVGRCFHSHQQSAAGFAIGSRKAIHNLRR
jgi:WD40 repeat protein